MPLSKVNRIELNGDRTISLVVGLDGFQKDSPIEISGQATQTNGAVATFYEIQTVPEPVPGPDGNPQTVVTLKSVPVATKADFVPADPITVVARAAEVWITTLDQDTGVTAEISTDAQAGWNASSYSYAVCQPGHTPPAGWP